jgi:hypothetical protein
MFRRFVAWASLRYKKSAVSRFILAASSVTSASLIASLSVPPVKTATAQSGSRFFQG